MRNTNRNFPFLLVVLAALWLALSGHGGGTPQVVDQPVGDDALVTVWTEPDEPRVGDEVHITVALYRAVEGHDEPIDQAQVQVRLKGPSGATPRLLPAEFVPGPPPLYAVDTTLDQPGPWQVEVLVTTANAQGQVSLEMQVAPADRAPRWLPWAALGLLAVLAVFAWRRRAS